MLITKEIEVTIVGYNVKYYKNLGYNIPITIKNNGEEKFILNSKIIIKIEDLQLGSSVKVHVKCDICGKDIYPEYSMYNRSVKKYKEKNIDSCDECKSEKVRLMQIIRNENMINEDGHGYWCDKDNLIKEFNKYYKQHGNLANMHKNDHGRAIVNGLQKHNENITSMALQLGYSIQDFGRIPDGWYYDFDKFKADVEKLINTYGRFPTVNEIQKDLRVGPLTISYHGGMQEIRNKFDYNQDENLLDDKNYNNASSLEYITAQFLIHNTNIEYDRNVIISPEDGRFNCDFRATIDNVDNDYLWIEVWGGFGEKRFKGEYDKTHDIKIGIYKKHNYKLIGLYPKDFANKSYEEIQDMLYEKFKPYIDLKFKHIDNKILSTYNNKTDEEVLEELMTYSDDGILLPQDTNIQTLNGRLYKEIYKRFGNFGKMAEKFNMINKLKIKPMGYWTEELALEYLIKIHDKYGVFLSKTETDDNKEFCQLCRDVCGNFDKLSANGGKMLMQLKCLNNNINSINNYDLLYLNKIIKGTIKVKPQHQLLAKQILEKYNNSQETNTAK